MNLTFTSKTGLVICTLLLAQAVQAATVTATYFDLGTYTAPTVNQYGITVTGSADVNVLSGNGLGIVGGAYSSTIDSSEYINFSFNDNVLLCKKRFMT